MSRLTFESDIEAYSTQFDLQSTSPAMALVSAVADVLETDPLDLDPLYEAVDTDALNDLLRPNSFGENPVWVSFTFASCEVSMASDGRVEITPHEEDSAENYR